TWKLSAISHPCLSASSHPISTKSDRPTLKQSGSASWGDWRLPSELEQYRPFHKAKDFFENSANNVSNPGSPVVSPGRKLTFVTGITPTPLGEGKSTTTLGLVQAFTEIGVDSCACIRQPSQGQRGAAGGGYSQVIPMDEFNLHLTGDIHAVTAANNLDGVGHRHQTCFTSLLSPMKALYRRLAPKDKPFTEVQQRRLQKLGIDKKMPSELTAEEARAFSRLDIDPATITWQRPPRPHGIFGLSKSGAALTADDLGVTGALCVLLKDCLKPNLMADTLAGGALPCPLRPVCQHSARRDQVAMKLVGPSGFGRDGIRFRAPIWALRRECTSSAAVRGFNRTASFWWPQFGALKYHARRAKDSWRRRSPLPDEYRRERIGGPGREGLPRIWLSTWLFV
uniref:Formate--tetrahydrofolate ligase n=1 Tax=Macrostomum lignano TaxID=282301 RepID=A0A1I8JP39_9PLAT